MKKQCQKCGISITGHFNQKYCLKCKKMVRQENVKRFQKDNPEKMREWGRKWSREHPNYYKERWARRKQVPGYVEKINAGMRRFVKKRRLQVMDYYGRKCACCGDNHIEFLTIDHINNDGAKHRKEIKGQNLPAWIYRHNYPKGFQILCFNCNEAKKIYGECPHNREK